MNFDEFQNYMKIKGIVNEYQLSSNSHWSVRFLQFCRGNIDCQCSEEWAHDFPANISKFREPWQATQLLCYRDMIDIPDPQNANILAG